MYEENREGGNGFEFQGKFYETDEEGYLMNFED